MKKFFNINHVGRLSLFYATFLAGDCFASVDEKMPLLNMNGETANSAVQSKNILLGQIKSNDVNEFFRGPALKNMSAEVGEFFMGSALKNMSADMGEFFIGSAIKNMSAYFKKIEDVVYESDEDEKRPNSVSRVKLKKNESARVLRDRSSSLYRQKKIDGQELQVLKIQPNKKITLTEILNNLKNPKIAVYFDFRGKTQLSVGAKLWYKIKERAPNFPIYKSVGKHDGVMTAIFAASEMSDSKSIIATLDNLVAKEIFSGDLENCCNLFQYCKKTVKVLESARNGDDVPAYVFGERVDEGDVAEMAANNFDAIDTKKSKLAYATLYGAESIDDLKFDLAIIPEISGGANLNLAEIAIKSTNGANLEARNGLKSFTLNEITGAVSKTLEHVGKNEKHNRAKEVGELVGKLKFTSVNSRAGEKEEKQKTGLIKDLLSPDRDSIILAVTANTGKDRGGNVIPTFSHEEREDKNGNIVLVLKYNIEIPGRIYNPKKTQINDCKAEINAAIDSLARKNQTLELATFLNVYNKRCIENE